MRVLVAGASGALGRLLVPQLLTAGHEVVGLTRRDDRAEALRRTGAEAIVADALDPQAVRCAVGDGLTWFIHLHDAAVAMVLAVTRGAPGIYNIVDDEPAPLREWLPVYAEALGAKPPHRVPRLLARLVGDGPFPASTGSQGASNAKAKAELGWQPVLPSWRDGFRTALGTVPPARPAA